VPPYDGGRADPPTPIKERGIVKRFLRVAADIPVDSWLAKAIEQEQKDTGRNLTDIVRAALADRYDYCKRDIRDPLRGRAS